MFGLGLIDLALTVWTHSVSRIEHYFLNRLKYILTTKYFLALRVELIIFLFLTEH